MSFPRLPFRSDVLNLVDQTKWCENAETRRRQNQPLLNREKTQGHKAQSVKIKEEEKQLFLQPTRSDLEKPRFYRAGT